jgi:hypothetical protein
LSKSEDKLPKVLLLKYMEKLGTKLGQEVSRRRGILV